MGESSGGGSSAEAEQVNRFTADTIAARNARVMAWVLIALGVACLVFAGMFYAAKHSGHDVVAAVTSTGSCSNGVCTVHVAYHTADGSPVSAVMFGVPSDEIYGSPAHRLLNINYDSGDESSPTTNDMPDAVLDWPPGGRARFRWVGCGGAVAEEIPAGLTVAAAKQTSAVPAASAPEPADQRAVDRPERISPRKAGPVTGEPGAVIVAERYRRWSAVIFTPVAAGVSALLITQRFQSLPPHGRVLATVACLAVAAAVSVWGCTRGWRIGLRLGDDGVTVRNYFRTYRISWPEVRCFADGSVSGGESGRLWALDVVLRDGRTVTASGTARSAQDARPQTLAAIRQAAARYGIQAELTGTASKRGSRESPANPGLYPDPGGQPGLRRWDGKQWSPLLQRADPGDGGPAAGNSPTEVWSPLAGSEPQWHDIAARIRRAEIVSAVWLAVAAAAGVATVELYARDLSNPQADYSLAALALGATGLALAFAISALARRKDLRKIERAGKAAAVLADTGVEKGTRWAVGLAVSVAALAVGVLAWQYPRLSHSATPRITNTPVPATNVGYYQLQAGECLTGANNLAKIIVSSITDWPDSNQVVPCDEPHIAEVFGVDHSYWNQDEGFPGDGSLNKATMTFCNGAFQSYVGIISDDSIYGNDYLYPGADTWSQGDRTVLCIAYESNSGNTGVVTLNKSIKGSDQWGH